MKVKESEKLSIIFVTSVCSIFFALLLLKFTVWIFPTGPYSLFVVIWPILTFITGILLYKYQIFIVFGENKLLKLLVTYFAFLILTLYLLFATATIGQPTPTITLFLVSLLCGYSYPFMLVYWNPPITLKWNLTILAIAITTITTYIVTLYIFQKILL